LHDTQDEIAQVGPPELAEAPGDQIMFIRSDWLCPPNNCEYTIFLS
jgi:hypothetical protein